MLDVVIPVHNGAATIQRLLDRLFELPMPLGESIRVTVVDDGSTDATADVLERFPGHSLRLVTLPERRGRANACNQGAARSSADYLLFLDADCLPVHDDYFATLFRRLAAGADLVYGPIGSGGEGFWPRYLKTVEDRRRLATEQGDHLAAMTSANLVVRRTLFECAGGFDPGYRHYGFEDKDLLARLLALDGKVAFEPGSAVQHDAGNTVANYCAKMWEAARWTAVLFARQHPDSYARMAFSRLEPASAGWSRRYLMTLAGCWLVTPAIRLAEGLVDRPGVPWPLQAFVVRLAAALSYLRGCLDRP